MGKAIEVILLEDVEGLGRSGDACKVKAGYARNFLFPRKAAVVMTPGTKRLIEKKREEAAARRRLVGIENFGDAAVDRELRDVAAPVHGG